MQTYGQSNYFPEMVNWTVEGAGLGEYLDGYFTLEFDVDEEPGLSDWNTNVVIDADPLFMEIGPQLLEPRIFHW